MVGGWEDGGDGGNGEGVQRKREQRNANYAETTLVGYTGNNCEKVQ